MKKLCVIIILFIIFTACGNNENQNNDGTNVKDSETPIIEETQNIYTAFPDIKMNGKEFIILTPEYFIARYLFNIEEETGEPLNDVAYLRDMEVEEKFGVVIKAYGVSDDNCHRELNKLVQSGDDSIDMVLPHPSTGGAVPVLITDGLLLDWADLKYVDFTKPCWNTDMQTALSVAGKSFYACGDISITGQTFSGIVFNKDLANSAGIEKHPYDSVLSGAWTMDKLMEFTKGVYIDVNGDGIKDKDDIYGYLSNRCDYVFLYSCGARVALSNTDGKPELCLLNDRLPAVFDKTYNLFYSDSTFLGYTNGKSGNENDAWKRFAEGGGIATSWDLGNYYYLLRPIESDIGILPFPKLDETQENYSNIVTAGFFCVPVNAKDLDNSSIVIQALMETSYKYLRPAFIDTVLYNKCLRDEESTQIVELILNNKIYDFGFSFDNERLFPNILLNIIVGKNSTEFMSYYEQNAAKVQANYDKIYDAVRALDAKG